MSAHRSEASSESDHARLLALEAENRELRARLREFTQAAGRNDLLTHQSAELELELLRTGSLTELVQLLVVGLRGVYQLDAVGLMLDDPRHEARHTLIEDGADERLVASVRFTDFAVGVAPQLAALDRPWLGPWSAAEHERLFGKVALGSVALIPLPRGDKLGGVLGFGSHEPQRFHADLASDLLAHLGVIAALCIENALNRARLLRAGLTDFLTGWNNRRFLQLRLGEELARAQRGGSSVACMMIDVDHFKRINDGYGHLAGDAVLRDIAHRIDGQLRQSDVRARFGGDEFAIVLPGVHLAEGERLASRILGAVTGRPLRLGPAAQETVTLSIGVASLEPPAGTRDYKTLSERLIAEADAALYRSKAGGRNRVCVAGVAGR